MWKRITALIAWLDRDWEARDYSGPHPLSHVFLSLAPLAVAAIVGEVLTYFGAPDEITTKLLIIGIIACLGVSFLSLARWMVGYSKTARQDKAAKAYRAQQERVAEERARERQP